MQHSDPLPKGATEEAVVVLKCVYAAHRAALGDSSESDFAQNIKSTCSGAPQVSNYHLMLSYSVAYHNQEPLCKQGWDAKWVTFEW